MTGDYKISMELLQETFSRVWLYLDTYTSFDGISFSSWLFKIASNVTKRYKLKKYQLNKEITANEIELPADEDWEDIIEDKICIHSMVNSLREPFRTAIALRYVEEFDYKDIASIMNTTPGQIKNYLFRAKKSLLKSWINKTI